MGDQQIADTLAQQFRNATNSATYSHGAGFDEEHKANIEQQVHNHRTQTSYQEHGPDYLSQPIALAEVYA
jgi:hypothetical protein